MEVIVVLREEETFVQVHTLTETILESIKQSPIISKHKKFTSRIKATTSTNKSTAPVTSIVLPSSRVAISVKVGSSIFVPLASSPSTFSQLVSSSLRISIPSSVPISSAVSSVYPSPVFVQQCSPGNENLVPGGFSAYIGEAVPTEYNLTFLCFAACIAQNQAGCVSFATNISFNVIPTFHLETCNLYLSHSRPC